MLAALAALALSASPVASAREVRGWWIVERSNAIGNQLKKGGALRLGELSIDFVDRGQVVERLGCDPHSTRPLICEGQQLVLDRDGQAVALVVSFPGITATVQATLRAATPGEAAQLDALLTTVPTLVDACPQTRACVAIARKKGGKDADSRYDVGAKATWRRCLDARALMVRLLEERRKPLPPPCRDAPTH